MSEKNLLIINKTLKTKTFNNKEIENLNKFICFKSLFDKHLLKNNLEYKGLAKKFKGLVKQPCLSKIIKGQTKWPDPKTLDALSKILGPELKEETEEAKKLSSKVQEIFKFTN